MAERMYSKEWFDKGDDGGVRLQGGGAGRGVRMNKRGMIETPPTVDKAPSGSGLERSKLKSDVEEGKGGLHSETLGGVRNMLEKSVEDRGGYPTRGGKPMMTAMQRRMAARKARDDEPSFGNGGIVRHEDKSYRSYEK